MRTRPFLFACLLFVLASSLASAQGFEIAPFIGYRFGGSVQDYYGGQTHGIEASESTGITLDFPLGGGPNYLELLYSHQGTHVDVGSITGTQSYPLGIDFWMFGGLREFPGQNEKVRPFLAAYVGMAHFSSSQGGIDSDNGLALGIGGGVKLDLSKHVGLRFDARGYFAFVSSSGGLYCGPYGCGASFSGSGLLQGEGTASLLIRF